MEDNILKDKFTEEELEQAIISLLEDQGYIYTSGENLHRKYEDVLLEDDLISYIEKRYSKENMTDLEKRPSLTN